jgi:hypothetical protein
MYHANNTFGLYHHKVKRIARDTIVRSRDLNDGTVMPRVYKKIQWYMVGTVVIGEMLSSLAGRKMQKSETESLVCLGAVMALFDIITDDYRFDRKVPEQILRKAFIENAVHEVQHDSPVIKICILYLEKLRESSTDEQWTAISEVTDLISIQLKSEEQFTANLSESSVKELTIKKGGVSILLSASILRINDKRILEALFETGGFIQMMNDCQDLYKDTVSGIKTFVHFCGNFNEILSRLEEEREKVLSLVNSLELPESSKYRFLFDINAMFIVIAHKLERYSETCNNILDFEVIGKMSAGAFRINPFSPSVITSCFGKIAGFNNQSKE